MISLAKGAFVQKFVEVQSMMHLTKGMFTIGLMKVVKKISQGFHMIIQSCI